MGIERRSRRYTQRAGALVAGALVAGALAPREARAQTGRGTGDAVQWAAGTITRDNPVRSAELVTRPVGADDGIGVRDCSCGDIWRFRVPYTPPANARNVEFWVGQTADACRNSANRGAVGTAQTCWQLNTMSGVVTQPIGGANLIDVLVRARWLVDPVNGQCTPPGTNRSLTGQLYLSAIFRPPDDATPYGSFQIDYNLQPPDPPRTISAAPLDGAARVTWSVVAATDGGTSTGPVSNTIRGFYILCLPGPPNATDAGTTTGDAAVCNGDGFRFPTDGGTSLDGGTTTDAGATTDGATVDASGTCTMDGLPAGFDVHDEEQFARYRCSTLQGVGVSSYDVLGLVNGQGYRFAVVSQDNTGNRAVSAVTPCVVPVPVSDFWERYEASGGRARPGYCAVGVGIGAAPTARRRYLAGGVLLASAALVAGLRRARKGSP